MALPNRSQQIAELQSNNFSHLDFKVQINKGGAKHRLYLFGLYVLSKTWIAISIISFLFDDIKTKRLMAALSAATNLLVFDLF
jgi:hypothetical protein